jgi:hypothetical protein
VDVEHHKHRVFLKCTNKIKESTKIYYSVTAARCGAFMRTCIIAPDSPLAWQRASKGRYSVMYGHRARFSTNGISAVEGQIPP